MIKEEGVSLVINERGSMNIDKIDMSKRGGNTKGDKKWVV